MQSIATILKQNAWNVMPTTYFLNFFTPGLQLRSFWPSERLEQWMQFQAMFKSFKSIILNVFLICKSFSLAYILFLYSNFLFQILLNAKLLPGVTTTHSVSPTFIIALANTHKSSFSLTQPHMVSSRFGALVTSVYRSRYSMISQRALWAIMMCVCVGVSPHRRLCSEPQCISISQCENSHAKSCHCIPVPLHLSKSSLITMATRKMVHQETLPAFKGPKHKSGASILLTGVQKTQGALMHRAPHRCLKR